MRLEDKEANRHGRIGLCQHGVRAGEKFFQRNGVAERFTHLLPVYGYHIIVHPVAHRIVALRGYGLGYLTFVVWEYQVHSSSVYVEVPA